RPSQSELDRLPTMAQVFAGTSSLEGRFNKAGFNGSNVVAFLPIGNSFYNSLSVTVTRRFSKGLQVNSAYTYSHLIDDSTADVFSTVLTPRRQQDFQNLRADKSDSALDRRNRFVFS